MKAVLYQTLDALEFVLIIYIHNTEWVGSIHVGCHSDKLGLDNFQTSMAVNIHKRDIGLLLATSTVVYASYAMRWAPPDRPSRRNSHGLLLCQSLV